MYLTVLPSPIGQRKHGNISLLNDDASREAIDQRSFSKMMETMTSSPGSECVQ